MNEPDDRPPADLESFFAAARVIPPAAPATRAALLDRLATSLGSGNGDPQGGDSGAPTGSAPHGNTPASPPPTARPLATGTPATSAEPPSPAPALASPPTAPLAAAPLGGKAIALAATLFALGAVTGVAVDRQLREPLVRVVTVERPAALPATAPAPVASSPPSAPPLPALSAPRPAPDTRSPSAPTTNATSATTTPPSAASSSPPPAASSSPPPGQDTDLAAERTLLERARSALARGNASGALEALGRHAAEHPRGRLTEEREALWIQSLLAAGRTGEARQRFARYRASFPRSFSLPALEAAVGER